MNCEIDNAWEDRVDCSTEIVRRARKAHKCNECGATIGPKEMYEYSTYLFDGRWREHKTCLTCKEIRDRLFCSWNYGAVWEGVWDHLMDLGDAPLCWFDGLSIPARDTLIETAQKYMDEED